MNEMNVFGVLGRREDLANLPIVTLEQKDGGYEARFYDGDYVSLGGSVFLKDDGSLDGSPWKLNTLAGRAVKEKGLISDGITKLESSGIEKHIREAGHYAVNVSPLDDGYDYIVSRLDGSRDVAYSVDLWAANGMRDTLNTAAHEAGKDFLSQADEERIAKDYCDREARDRAEIVLSNDSKEDFDLSAITNTTDRLRDKNGDLLRVGDTVRIENAYSESDNGLYYVEHSPIGDPGWEGRNFSLQRLNEDGTLNDTRSTSCFWPIRSTAGDVLAQVVEADWNAGNATIEIVHDVNREHIKERFASDAADYRKAAEMAENRAAGATAWVYRKLADYKQDVVTEMVKEDSMDRASESEHQAFEFKHR